jgi:hypothetical protein
MTANVKDFYLCTLMDRYQYMRIPVSIIPQEIFEQYNLAPLLHNGGIYIEICSSMYGLPQAGCLANDALVPLLIKHGYNQCKHTPGLFQHDTQPVI